MSTVACVNVAPYDREYFADPIMSAIDNLEEESYHQHMHRALSQGLVGSSAASSGCGCEQ